MYIDSINKNNTDYALSSFGNIIVCLNDIDDAKTVTFPNGFVNADPEPYLAFQVLFVNGHNCVDSTTYMTLNGYDVMVNKDGTLINLPIHEFTESSDVVYKSLQSNTILNLFFDGTQFVIIGNPTVLSSADYEIYANGYTKDGNAIGTIIPFYGSFVPKCYFACDGTDTTGTDKELQTYYPTLYTLLGNTNVLPDLRECTLVGVGQNNSDIIVSHDVYTLGEFKDDQLQSHSHTYRQSFYYDGAFFGGPSMRGSTSEFDSTTTNNSSARFGTTTHGKQKGVNYIIKATNEWK